LLAGIVICAHPNVCRCLRRPLILPFRSRAKLDAQGRGLKVNLADRAARGNIESPLR